VSSSTVSLLLTELVAATTAGCVGPSGEITVVPGLLMCGKSFRPIPWLLRWNKVAWDVLQPFLNGIATMDACMHAYWLILTGEQGKDDCVFDVLTTGYLEMALVGAY
jgi:hypothetical protein